MKITRLYTGTDNRSYFEDIDVPFDPGRTSANFPCPIGAKAVFFREIPPGYVYSWHNVVCREYVVMIDGRPKSKWAAGRSGCLAREMSCLPRTSPEKDTRPGASARNPGGRSLSRCPDRSGRQYFFWQSYGHV